LPSITSSPQIYSLPFENTEAQENFGAPFLPLLADVALLTLSLLLPLFPDVRFPDVREYCAPGAMMRPMSLRPPQAEPRWPVLIAMSSVVALNFALPEMLSVGPRWLLAVVFVVLATALMFFHSRDDQQKAYVIGLVLSGSITTALVISLTLLIRALPAHKVEPVQLLRSAGSLWISNVLVFAVWYWRLDAGGPYQREKVSFHHRGAFLFPQMALHQDSPTRPDFWQPRFIDYLFLSFNTSTALSPTDTAVLSRWAKALMMLQSAISLSIIVLLAARAVNIL